MVLEPGGGLSFPPPPGAGGNGTTGGSLIAPATLFQRTTPVFPFHLTGWAPHHTIVGQVQRAQVQQSIQHAAVRFLNHHHPHHQLPGLGSHQLVPVINGHHSNAHHLHHGGDHGDEDEDKKGRIKLVNDPVSGINV